MILCTAVWLNGKGNNAADRHVLYYHGNYPGLAFYESLILRLSNVEAVYDMPTCAGFMPDAIHHMLLHKSWNLTQKEKK